LRIGILGGTFDPIHLGHLRLAEEVGEDLGLESIYLVPALYPPHKEKRSVGSFDHRFAMTELAACESPLFKASDLEGRRETISYSIDTLREFHRMFEGLQLYFIMGLDAFLEIDTWREYRQLFHYAHFVVIQRPGLPTEKLEPYLFSLDVGYRKRWENGLFEIPGGHSVIYKKATLMEISSTDIRRRVANGRSIRFLVPEPVRSYIIDKGLYSGDGSTR